MSRKSWLRLTQIERLTDIQLMRARQVHYPLVSQPTTQYKLPNNLGSPRIGAAAAGVASWRSCWTLSAQFAKYILIDLCTQRLQTEPPEISMRISCTPSLNWGRTTRSVQQICAFQPMSCVKNGRAVDCRNSSDFSAAVQCEGLACNLCQEAWIQTQHRRLRKTDKYTVEFPSW